MDDRKIDIDHLPEWVVHAPFLRASLMPAITGASKYMTEAQSISAVVKDALGIKNAAEFLLPEPEAIKHGNINEAFGVEALEFEIEEEIKHTGANQLRLSATYQGINFSATPDGYIPNKHALVEIKCPLYRNLKSLKDCPEYTAQIQAQLFVARLLGMDVDRTYFAIYKDGRIIWEIVPFDPTWIKTHIKQFKTVWDGALAILNDRTESLWHAGAIERVLPIDSNIQAIMELNLRIEELQKDKRELMRYLNEDKSNRAYLDAEGKVAAMMVRTPAHRLNKKRVEEELKINLADYQSCVYNSTLKFPKRDIWEEDILKEYKNTIVNK